MNRLNRDEMNNIVIDAKELNFFIMQFVVTAGERGELLMFVLYVLYA